MERIRRTPVLSCIGIFLICSAVRIAEYFVLRTDETIISENFIHKLFGIALLFVILRSYDLRWSDIGINGRGVCGGIGKGMLLGGACFFIAYSAECLILYYLNRDVHLECYVSGFSLANDMQKQTGIVFILLCVAFNIVNVLMEEGVFRGLFACILGDKPFAQSCLIIAIFFGVWHLVMPFRDYTDGNSSLFNMLAMGIGYIILAGIMSVKWSLLYRISGSLWIGVGDHFFNNVIVTNLLHVVSNGEADSLQIIRIVIGQLISFALVWTCYKKHRIKIRKGN